MQPRFSALRAVSAMYALRLIRSIAIKVAIIVVTLFMAIWYLSCAVSHWWGIIAIPVGLFGLVTGVAYLIVRGAVRYFSSNLTTAQQQAAVSFIDKLDRVASKLQTPHLIVAYRIIRDVVLKRKQLYLHELTEDSVTLTTEFNRLSKLFE